MILDVLEHLYSAEKLLINAGKLLKPDGKILISMPNIAHNSIIINLYNNKFVYTQDGILDDTHVKFYTYASFCNLLHKCHYRIICKEAKQIPVGMNEVEATYNDVPKSVEYFLRTRPLADIYQFLFVAEKNESNSIDETSFKPMSLPETQYKVQIYFDGKAENIREYISNPQNIDLVIDVPKENYKFVRIDPIEYKGVLQILKVEGQRDSGYIQLQIDETNGIEIADDVYFFPEDDPNVYVRLKDGISKLHFVCRCHDVNSDQMDIFFRISDRQKQQTNLLNQFEREKDSLQNAISRFSDSYTSLVYLLKKSQEQEERLKDENDNLNDKILSDQNIFNTERQRYEQDAILLEQKIHNLEKALTKNEEELNQIKETKIYKLFEKIRRYTKD